MKTSGEQEKKLKVINGKLYFDGECVGEAKDIAGFTQYYFEEEPLGYGANGVTFCVTHKILNVKQVIKIYFPKENEKYVSHKAQEEARKNANTALAGSRGRCINWENVWNTYPFNRINISQVFHAKRCDDYYIVN